VSGNSTATLPALLPPPLELLLLLEPQPAAIAAAAAIPRAPSAHFDLTGNCLL
jgi:hypothetical protein